MIKNKNDMIKCKYCKTLKPEPDFYSYNKSRCKKCCLEYEKKWKKENRKTCNQYAMKYRHQKNPNMKYQNRFSKYLDNKEYLKKLAGGGFTYKEVSNIIGCSDRTVWEYANKYKIKFKHGKIKNPEDCNPNYYRKGYWKNGRKRNKKAEKVGRIARKAVKDGLIERKNYCEICGSKNKIRIHHYNYNKPLKIIWVCPVCHRNTHIKKLDQIKNVDLIQQGLGMLNFLTKGG